MESEVQQEQLKLIIKVVQLSPEETIQLEFTLNPLAGGVVQVGPQPASPLGYQEALALGLKLVLEDLALEEQQAVQ